MTRLFRVTGISLLACATLAMAAVDAYTIKFTPKTGTTTKYMITAQLDVNGNPITFTSLSQEKIASVADDGTYTIEQTQLEAKMNDQAIDAIVPPTTTKVKPGGIISEIKGDNVGSADYRFANLTQFVEPGKPVSVNDTWGYEYPSDTKLGSLKCKVDYTVVGEEKVGDIDTLKVKATAKETEGDDKSTVDGFVWLNKADWTLVKSQSKWTNVPVPGAPMLINADVTMALQK